MSYFSFVFSQVQDCSVSLVLVQHLGNYVVHYSQQAWHGLDHVYVLFFYYHMLNLALFAYP